MCAGINKNTFVLIKKCVYVHKNTFSVYCVLTRVIKWAEFVERSVEKNGVEPLSR